MRAAERATYLLRKLVDAQCRGGVEVEQRRRSKGMLNLLVVGEGRKLRCTEQKGGGKKKRGDALVQQTIAFWVKGKKKGQRVNGN